MRDNDTQLLSEAYGLILEGKALTPEQIAKNAQPAGSAGKKGEGLPKNTKEDKEVTKTLEKVPYTDQHADNFDQDGKDTAVEDPYVVKESDAFLKFYGLPQPKSIKVIKEADATGSQVKVTQPAPVVTDAVQPTSSTPTVKTVEEYVAEITAEFTEALETINDELESEVGAENVNRARLTIAALITRLTGDFKRGVLPSSSETPERPDHSNNAQVVGTGGANVGLKTKSGAYREPIGL